MKKIKTECCSNPWYFVFWLIIYVVTMFFLHDVEFSIIFFL